MDKLSFLYTHTFNLMSNWEGKRKDAMIKSVQTEKRIDDKMKESKFSWRELKLCIKNERACVYVFVRLCACWQYCQINKMERTEKRESRKERENKHDGRREWKVHVLCWLLRRTMSYVELCIRNVVHYSQKGFYFWLYKLGRKNQEKLRMSRYTIISTVPFSPIFVRRSTFILVHFSLIFGKYVYI